MEGKKTLLSTRSQNQPVSLPKETSVITLLCKFPNTLYISGQIKYFYFPAFLYNEEQILHTVHSHMVWYWILWMDHN
jgi:hypothetical protein